MEISLIDFLIYKKESILKKRIKGKVNGREIELGVDLGAVKAIQIQDLGIDDEWQVQVVLTEGAIMIINVTKELAKKILDDWDNYDASGNRG